MDIFSLLAATVAGQEHRIGWFDWNYLVIIGFLGNAVFSMRFLVQWRASEKAKDSVIPLSFWYWSIGGSVIMAVYFFLQRDPVGVLAYLPNSFIYLRNLALIRKKKLAMSAAAASQTPIEESEPAGSR